MANTGKYRIILQLITWISTTLYPHTVEAQRRRYESVITLDHPACHFSMIGPRVLASCDCHGLTPGARLDVNVTDLLLMNFFMSHSIWVAENVEKMEVLLVEGRPTTNSFFSNFSSQPVPDRLGLKVFGLHNAGMGYQTIRDLLHGSRYTLEEFSLLNSHRVELAFLKETLSSLRNLISLGLIGVIQPSKDKTSCSFTFDAKKELGNLAHVPITSLDISNNKFNVITVSLAEVFPHVQTLDISTSYLLAILDDITPIVCSLPNLEYLVTNRERTDAIHEGPLYSHQDLVAYITGMDHTPDNGVCCIVHKPGNNQKELESRRTWIAHQMLEDHAQYFAGKLFKCYLPTTIAIHSRLTDKVTFNFGFYDDIQLPELECLDFRSNQLNLFTIGELLNMRSLKTLLLGHNRVDIIYFMTELADIVTYTLETLDLSYNSIEKFPYEFFQHLYNLRNINLSGNAIADFNVSIGEARYLKNIDLSQNAIIRLPATVCKELEDLSNSENDAQPITLNLNGNPLSCDCHSLDFISWFQSTDIQITDKNTTLCYYPFQLGVSIAVSDILLDEIQLYCFPSHTKLIVTAAGCSAMVTLLMVLVIALYCKRWRLKYWWYLAQKAWKRNNAEAYDMNYDHDVFVAYTSQDSAWVHGPLLEEMEEKRGLRLCIHQRDFIPGHVLEEVIAEKIQTSRKTLLVLTPNFVNSHWCNFEVHMARSRLFDEGVDVITIVILEPLPQGCINKTLYQLLKKKLYLEWPESSDGRELFWRKLADALRDTRAEDSLIA